MIETSLRKSCRIGFIGLGIMGRPMVARLLSLGWQVTVWNLEAEMAQPALDAGAKWANSPREVREKSDVVMICVLDAKAVEFCCFDKDGLASADGGADILVDFSTMNPDSVISLAQKLQEKTDITWIDAPISGGPEPAAEGKLTLMAGGRDDAFDRVKPILADLASNVTLMGPLSSGQAAKVINQAIVGTCYTLMAEVLAISRASGIESAHLPACLAGGLADSVILQRIFPQMEQRAFDPPKSFARQLNKDMQNLKKFCHELDLDLPLINAAVDRYSEFLAQGNEFSDSASISRLYE